MNDPKFEYILNKADRDNDLPLLNSRYKKSSKNKIKQLAITFATIIIVLIITESVEDLATKINIKILAILLAGFLGAWISEWLQHRETSKQTQNDVKEQLEIYKTRQNELSTEIIELKEKLNSIVDECNNIYNNCAGAR